MAPSIDEVAAAMTAHLPQPVDHILVQADLTAVAPGPLEGALASFMRLASEIESRGGATVHRFTHDSIRRALDAGWTAADVLDTIRRSSRTPLPQPLEYLITSTASRHGLVRVRVEEHGYTAVESPDPGVLGAIAVDQALRPLGLIQDGPALVTRVDRDIVYWSLADARYPVVAVDAAGEPESVSRRRRSQTSAPEGDVRSYAALIARLRDTHETDADAAWLGRELEQAVRARSIILAAVRLPDGS